jgi:hypothetical protein
MRKVLALLALTVLVAAGGCPPREGGLNNLLRPSGVTTPPPTEVPSKEDLVSYLNNNAAGLPGIKSDDVDLTCYAGPVPVTVRAKLRAAGPRNFRMSGELFGSTEVDLGSNPQEFWYWIKRSEPPYQVFCSYQALEEGKVKVMPFPFQPDWILEAMGMGKYGPPEKYGPVVAEKGQLKLIEKTKSPQGQWVKKVIVFNHRKAKNNDEPQVTDFLLLDDAKGTLICSAHVTRRLVIPGKGEIPRELELSWPEQKLKLVMHLNSVQVDSQIAPVVFVRAPMKGVQSFDLATGRVEGMQQAGGMKGPGVQR